MVSSCAFVVGDAIYVIGRKLGHCCVTLGGGVGGVVPLCPSRAGVVVNIDVVCVIGKNWDVAAACGIFVDVGQQGVSFGM